MTASPPFGLDHWTFLNPRHPKDVRWRQAATTEPEIGIRAAVWHDEPFDLSNATRAAHHRCLCSAEAAGRLL